MSGLFSCFKAPEQPLRLYRGKALQTPQQQFSRLACINHLPFHSARPVRAITHAQYNQSGQCFIPQAILHHP